MRPGSSLAVTTVLLASSVTGATLEVPAEYGRIQDAIDAAGGGDTVRVHPGTYVEAVDAAVFEVDVE